MGMDLDDMGLFKIGDNASAEIAIYVSSHMRRSKKFFSFFGFLFRAFILICFPGKSIGAPHDKDGSS
jgi:hypothetical protein